MSKISHIRFDNRNLRELPLDPKPFEKEESRQVPNAVFAKTKLQPVKAPKVVSYSTEALKLIGVDANAYPRESDLEGEIALFLGGNSTIPDSGCEPYAHCYCGHQFGSFAGQLGDGASMYLGEIFLELNGDNAKSWGEFRADAVELTLKGAGKTPFSRNSDGRKVLRSSIREFLASEAMHHLGIPTTRSASCVTSASTVQRDPYYDGRVIDEQCAVITRIAPTFFRFGSYEIFKSKAGTSSYDRSGPSAGNELLKKRLLDRVVSFFPAAVSSIADDRTRYQAYFLESVRLTAELAAKWNAFGFVHGVLNTDNMSVLGLTIDYGPYAFMEYFDPDFTPNGSDSSGRYTYECQADATKWNLHKLAEMLNSLTDDDSLRAKDIVDANFDRFYKGEYYRLLRSKLGFFTQQPDDEVLISEFFSTLAKCNTDFTDSFQAIVIYHETIANAPSDSVVSSRSAAADALVDRLTERSAAPLEVISALKRKMRIHRLSMHPQQISSLWDMLETSPSEVQEMFGGAPIEAVRDEITGEKAKLDRLVHCSAEIKRLENLSPTTKIASDRQKWESWVERYIARITLDDALQASAQIDLIALQRRVSMMRKHNPTFVLRNWVMQDAIQAAESGDFSQVRTLAEMIKTPFSEKFSSFATGTCQMPHVAGAAGGLSPGNSAISAAERKFVSKPPVWAPSVLCTCSS
jgi:uncharacterized protein YdiU (UPF0061 family)